jgi:hypothetical protein
MSVKTYDTTGSTVNINPNSDSDVQAFANAIALVGGYNASQASNNVSTNTAYSVRDAQDARDLFGDCELTRAVQAAAANPVETIWCVPVPETSTTESISSGTSITLSNTPIFDGTLHPEHDVTVTDTGSNTDLTVKYYYDGSPPTPSDSDTANVNPITGEVETDASGNYDVDYTYGDYADALAEAALQDVRYVVPLTEDDGIAQTALTEVQTEAENLEFSRVMRGARPNIQPNGATSYSVSTNDWRLVEVAPARGTTVDGAVRTVAAFAGLAAGQPINGDGAVLYDTVNGLTDLNVQYRSTEADDFSEVSTIDRNDEIVQSVTTSTEDAFSNLNEVELVDYTVVELDDAIDDYKGTGNTAEKQTNILGALYRRCRALTATNPPILGAPADDAVPFSVSEGTTTNDNTAKFNVSISPTPVLEEIVLNVNVGTITTFDGASVA